MYINYKHDFKILKLYHTDCGTKKTQSNKYKQIKKKYNQKSYKFKKNDFEKNSYDLFFYIFKSIVHCDLTRSIIHVLCVCLCMLLFSTLRPICV